MSQHKKMWYFISVVSLSMVMVHASYAVSKDLAEDILVFINQFRLSHGLSKLQMNPLLIKEATQHSSDMAMHRVAFGHDGFAQRIKYLQQHIKTAQGGAENVAYNYKTAKIVAEGWISSPGHRRNILGSYNQTGIGIVKDKYGKLYFTQIFLKT